ncbi:8788_t:CDS:2, partial [Funneliformis caledonium]
MIAKDMVEQLQILANKGEIQVKNVLKITKVLSWITRYAVQLTSEQRAQAIILLKNSFASREIAAKLVVKAIQPFQDLKK